jgi:hypothetical protein
VASTAIDTLTDQRVPRFATAVVVPIAVFVTGLHCAASTFGDDHWFDEVYMLAIGRYHLDWGSADQPPLAPALAALMDWLAPRSQFVRALPAALATGCAVLLAGLIAREIGCDRRAQGFTAAAQATGIWTTFAGHWLTPYSLEPAQWLLLFWLLLRWNRLRDDRLLIAAGVVVGIAAQTKFQVLLLCVVLLAAMAVLGPRELAPAAVGGCVHRCVARRANAGVAVRARLAPIEDGTRRRRRGRCVVRRAAGHRRDADRVRRGDRRRTCAVRAVAIVPRRRTA